MLVLSRKIGEVITIGNSITVQVLSFDRGIVRIGIEAPKNIAVHRREVFDKIIEMNMQAVQTDTEAIQNAFGSLDLELSPPVAPVEQELATVVSKRHRRNGSKAGTQAVVS
ncbi:MAG: carbon storage regulator CsrA [Candidatus Kapaibacterium sp.]